MRKRKKSGVVVSQTTKRLSGFLEKLYGVKKRNETALLYCGNCRIGYDAMGLAFKQCQKCRKRDCKLEYLVESKGL